MSIVCEKGNLYLKININTCSYGDFNKMRDKTVPKSRYREGFVEGIYIRLNKDGFLKSRCKLVRPDFIQHIEDHWSKTGLIKNKITFS